MKSEEEIKRELKEFKKEQCPHGPFRYGNCSPRQWGKIKALEWVIGD